ncbi:MAG: PAS domain S-box protein [Bacteroidetes bacterium]|nr:MAG: PAS domain S-box protein [Bacteroidota bacterium]
MSVKSRINPTSISLILAFMAGIFILDAWFVHDSNLSFAYLLVVILGLFFSEKNDVVLLSVSATALTVIAVILQYYEGVESTLDEMLFSRTISVAGIWTGAYLVITIINMREDEVLQEEQFHALFRFATNGILIANDRGQIVRINPAAEQLFGYTAEELSGRLVEVLIPARLSKLHENHRKDFKNNPRPRTMGTGLDLYAVRKDGVEFPVEVSLSPFRTEEGDFIMAFVVDNTLRKENEQRIMRQNQKLEQLAGALQNLNEGLEEKVMIRTRELEKAKNDLSSALATERELGELKSRFVSMASHEFRTPLSTVLSSASLINAYADRQDFENIKKHSQRIKSAVNNLNTILSEFLSLGKLEEGRTELNLREISLPEIIEEVHSEIKGLFRAGQELDYEHEGTETALLDPGLLKHALLNLFSNATKYSPENSTITIRTSISPERITLRIIDQGMGIPLADQKHLFTRFFRATNATNIQGTGLGLYIVKRYVELMGGEIGFKSEEGKGTEFWVHIHPQEKLRK